MNIKRRIVCMAMALGCYAGASHAAEPPAVAAPLPRRFNVCCTWCCDDYCRKPLPVVPCPTRGCVDDYCRKPMTPVPPCLGCWHPNDYCRKPLTGCPQNCEPWYVCVPMSPPGEGNKAPPKQ